MSDDKSYPSLGQKNKLLEKGESNTRQGYRTDTCAHTKDETEAKTNSEALKKHMDTYSGKIVQKARGEMASFREFSDEDAPKSEE